MRTNVLIRLTLLAAVALGAAPATASAALTASGARVGSQPAFVRVVVDFTGGRLEFNETNAEDPNVADGSARVDVSHTGVAVRAGIDRTGHRVRVRVTRLTADRLRVRLDGAARRFKYVRVFVLHGPERLVIDLYRSAPPSDAAEIRMGLRKCLTLTGIRAVGHTFVVRGTELNLFEGSFVIRVRDARGRVVGRHIATARGAWSRAVAYGGVTSRQAGTVEAVAGSAKDGSLACLVQRRVTLLP